MKGTVLDSEVAEAGSGKLLEAVSFAFNLTPGAIKRIRDIVAAKPAGTGEAGQNFDEAHAAVETGLEAIGKLVDQMFDMGLNLKKGVAGTVSDDEVAAALVNAPALQDIPNPDFKF